MWNKALASARFTKENVKKGQEWVPSGRNNKLPPRAKTLGVLGAWALMCVSMRGVYSYLFFYNSYFGFRPTDQPTNRPIVSKLNHKAIIRTNGFIMDIGLGQITEKVNKKMNTAMQT